MRLNKNIESYDIKSLQGIEQGVTKMKEHCDILCQLGLLLKKKIQDAREGGFQDPNMNRAEEQIDTYLENMKNAQMEYAELSDSVKEYVEKINDIWSDWN